MYHKGESKELRLRAILGGGFAPKWLPLTLFAEPQLPQSLNSLRQNPLERSVSKLLMRGLFADTPPER